jgi:glycyl-tRNA synthetase
MPEVAEKLFKDLKSRWNTFYDDKGAIGRRYRRQDEVGTPFCITIDGDSVSAGTVTVRQRDSMAQERIAIDQVVEYLNKALSGV